MQSICKFHNKLTRATLNFNFTKILPISVSWSDSCRWPDLPSLTDCLYQCHDLTPVDGLTYLH